MALEFKWTIIIVVFNELSSEIGFFECVCGGVCVCKCVSVCPGFYFSLSCPSRILAAIRHRLEWSCSSLMHWLEGVIIFCNIKHGLKEKKKSCGNLELGVCGHLCQALHIFRGEQTSDFGKAVYISSATCEPGASSASLTFIAYLIN